MWRLHFAGVLSAPCAFLACELQLKSHSCTPRSDSVNDVVGSGAGDAEATPYDAAVIGGGVVGLTVTHALAVRGWKVATLERLPHLIGDVSSGNSGIGCTGYDAPPGSLERALLRRSISLHQRLYPALGLSLDHVRKCGSMVVAWTADDVRRIDDVVRENVEAGDAEVRRLPVPEALELEPELNPAAMAAVMVPREVVAEPFFVPLAYAAGAQAHGARLLPGHDVCSTNRGPDGVWTLGCRNGSTLRARWVINCSGLWGDATEALRDPSAPVDFAMRPKKGQFVIMQPPPGVELQHVLQPVPTLATKGVHVFMTLYGQVVVGPTAEPTEDRRNRSTNASTVAELVAFGRHVVPALRDAVVVGTYSGIRPGTTQRDYIIRANHDDKWATVAGIRSTGLTAAPAIGAHVAQLVMGAPVCHPNTAPPYPAAPLRPQPKHHLPPLPPLEELARQYVARGDGTVEAWGMTVKVTHPISQHGLAAMGKRLLDAQPRHK